MAHAVCPIAFSRSNIRSMRQAPSSRLYSVCTCRWVNCLWVVSGIRCFLFGRLRGSIQTGGCSWIFFMRWESPALLTGGSNFCASLASGRSGYCIRSLAVWRRVSGRVFSAPAACSFQFASCTCTAAFTLLLMLAVSQLERRFVLLRISLYMRWSMIRMAAPPAPIKVSRSSI